MKSIINWVNQLSHYKQMIIAVLFLVFTFYVLPQANEYLELKETPDPMFHYTVEDINRIGQDLGEIGRERYILSRVVMDLPWPVVYALTFTVLLNKLYGPKKIILLPFLSMCLDFGENIFNMYLMWTFPSINSSLVFLASSFTSLKWLSLMAVLVFLLVALLLKLKKTSQKGS